MIAVRIGEIRRVVCASEDYLRRNGRPRTLEDLCGHQCVRHTGLTPHDEWRFLEGRNVRTVGVRSRVSSKEIDSALQSCEDGMGLGMFLSYMVAPHVRAGRLVVVLEEYEPAPIPAHVVYPQTRFMSNKVRALVDDCVSSLRQTSFA